LSVDDERLNQSVKLYPNPVENILSIKSETIQVSKVEFYSVIGKKIKEIKSNFNSITTNDLPNGIYIIKIFSKKGSIIKKIIKM